MTVFVTELGIGFRLRVNGQPPCDYDLEEAIARLVYFYIDGWKVVYE